MICFRPLLGNISSLVALILLLLCLFAGSSRQFLPNATIYKVNTSSLALKDAPDFFNVYMMGYCFGFEKECVVDDALNSTTLQSSITACSDPNLLFRFQPGQAIIKATDESGSAPETGWPSYLNDDFIALAPTSQAMTILYLLGTCAVGLSVALRLSTVRYIWQPREPIGLTNAVEPPPGYSDYPKPLLQADLPPSTIQLTTFITSSILLTIASIIATLISSQFTSLISRSGNPSISAESNSIFLGMTWTAVVIQILLAGDALIALFRYRARHCHCDSGKFPVIQGPETKRLFSGYD